MGSRTTGALAQHRRRAPAWRLLALALSISTLSVGCGIAAQAPRPRPGVVPPVAPAGVPNFGVVNAQLYRGAQPDDSGFAHLKERGISIVVNFRHEAGRIARERTLVEGQGMQYVSIPWRGYDTPKTEQVAQFLRLLRDHPQQKVFVHCQRGAERTGVMIASYRISREQWTPERALAEMRAFGFRSRFAHLAQFVRDFPALRLRDPVLRFSAGLGSSD